MVGVKYQISFNLKCEALGSSMASSLKISTDTILARLLEVHEQSINKSKKDTMDFCTGDDDRDLEATYAIEAESGYITEQETTASN